MSSENVQPLLVNKRELAMKLGWSIPTLDNFIAEHSDFPVEQRGSMGTVWVFDAKAAVEFVRAKRDEREQEEAARAQAFEQFSLPIDSVAPGGAMRLSPVQRAQAALARQRERDLAIKAGLLVETSEIRRCLSQFLTKLGRGLDQLPLQIGRSHNLPEAVVVAMRRSIDEYRRAAVSELKEFFAAEIAAEERDESRASRETNAPHLKIVSEE